MTRKIVADSSANILTLENCNIPYASVPLKIVTAQAEYTDDNKLDVLNMVQELSIYKGKSGSSCPNSDEWLKSFGDADEVFGVSLTSNLSGCYNASQIAAQMYMDAHPDRKVFILDSLSTGPELSLIIEKFISLINSDKSFEDIVKEIKEYSKETHLMFQLESLNNFVNNGRVNPAIAKAAGLLGICVVGKASDQGDLEVLHKCRGAKKAISTIFESMKNNGFNGGKVRIDHTFNPEAANKLAQEIKSTYPDCDIKIGTNKGLCSFYTENNGLLVGYESNLK